MNLQYLGQRTSRAFIATSFASALSVGKTAWHWSFEMIVSIGTAVARLWKRALWSMRTKYWIPDLMDGEVCVHKGRIHPVMFLWAIFWVTIACTLSRHDGSLLFLTKFIGSMAIANALGAIVFYYCTIFSVTDYRLIYRVGFISRDSRDLLLHNIDYVRVEQTILGRLLNYGTMTVVGSANIAVKMAPLRDPLACRKKLQEQINLRHTKERKP